MHEQILLVEDEAALQMTLSEMLRREGYEVEVASDGARAFEQASARSFDLIILDATLPGRNYIEVCRDIREAGLVNPILLLTAGGQTAHTVLGLRFGADDCVTKPFDLSELLARIEALLRRRPVRTEEGVHHFGAIHIDIPGRKVTREGRPVFLAFREFELLRYFVEHAGIPLARDELLRKVWGYEAGTFTRTVDMHVAALRHKLETNSKSPELILTVAGIGYQFGN